MATLGSTAEPTTAAEYWGLNSKNHHADTLTLPSGGPWEIYRLGAWLAGVNASASVKLCLWSSGGSLLKSSATFTAAGAAFALGNSSKYEMDITPHEVNGSTTVYVGFARDPSDPVQFSTRSGDHVDYYSSSWPVSFTGWSTHSGGMGVFLYYQSANVAPNAPVSLSPTGNAVVSSGTAPTVSGTRSDSDSGDYITYYQIIVYEDNGTTVIQDTGSVAVSGSPTTFSRALALNGSHKYVKWKARTWDKEGVSGPFSAQQRFYVNSVPSTPGAPTVESATLVPDISGSFTDSGDTLAAVQIEVTLNASPYTSKWSSGDIAKSGSSWSQAYGGSALAWGTAYRARYRVKDSHGAYSSWSSWKTFTQSQPAGPSNMTPRTTNPRLSDLTPDLTIGHSANFRNHEIEVMTGAGTGTLLWDVNWGTDYANTTSKVVTYAGTALNWGQTYYWRSRIELSSDGTLTDWSPWYPIRLNATPSSPTGLTPTGGVVVSTLTPTFEWLFSDADLDQGDAQATYTIEVRNNATDALISTQTGTTADFRLYNGTALAYETIYKWRIKVTDTMGLESAYSAYQVFKPSQPPSATLTAPAGGSTVTESTPTLDWAFSSPGGKTQYAYKVEVFDKGPVGANYADEVPAYDSGTVISSATSMDLPFGVLEDGHDYRWQVTVEDTDHLTYVLT